MVPTTKNLNCIVANPPARVPASLRDVHDHEPEPRRQSALRRLAHIVGAPLESMPADIDWFDARFPRDGVGATDTHWTSARAYRRWRSAVRSAIRRHVIAIGFSTTQRGSVQFRRLVITMAYSDSPIAANQVLRHDGIGSVMAYYANFRKSASGPKSD